MGGALTDAEQRAHAELAHRRYVKHFDPDPQLCQARGAAGEFAGEQHVRRLVDEVARQNDAVGDRLRAVPGLFRRRRIGAGKIQLDFLRPLLVFLALGLVTIEGVGAQPRTQRQIGDFVAFERTGAEFGKNCCLCRGRWQLSHRNAAKFNDIARL